MSIEEKIKLRALCRECARLKTEFDADCNDCKYFVRGKMFKANGLTKFEGHCNRFNRSTEAWPNWFTGHECFEHRRTELSHTCVDFTREEFYALIFSIQFFALKIVACYEQEMEAFDVQDALKTIC